MDLTLSEFVVLAVGSALAAVTLLSLVSRFFHHRAEFQLALQRIQCRICGKLYLSEEASKLSHCPQCDALNLRSKNGKLG